MGQLDEYPVRLVTAKAGFSPGEQRVLLAALEGRTDEELATDLAISPWTVKNTWRSIFARAGRQLPHVLPNRAEIDSDADTRRGKEKRTRLLAYVRDHPEELRLFTTPVQRSLSVLKTRPRCSA